jgi:hypothetical protein
MARHVESLGLGLWTAPSPATLENGQLSYLQNGVYLPGSLALQRARGRSVFGSATAVATDIDGLRDIQFDNGNHYLVAMISGTATGNGSYRYATVGDTGTFANLVSGFNAGSQLEVVHYRNRFFLLNGSFNMGSATAVNTNYVAYLSATATASTPLTRQHGMLPVVSTPFVTATAGTFSQTVTGYYEYWTTEVATSTQDSADFSMESTFVGSPATIFVSATSVVPLISRPDIVNTVAATHWRVYRSPKKDRASDKKFPIGFSIAGDISIAATSMMDTATVTSTGAIFPANFNGIADSATNFIDMGAQATALASDNNVDGTMAISGGLSGLKKQGVYGYNFGGFVGPVQGIEVVVEALVNAGSESVSVTLVRGRLADGGYVPPGPYLSRISREQDAIKNKTSTKTFTATTVRTNYTLGGSSDRWFPSDQPNPFRDSDFTSAGFMVIIGLTSTAAVTLSVDYVSVKVYYGGSIDSVVVFPTVVYTFGDISAQVGKNGPPPSSSTGDLFEDALVVNDVSNPALIRYSVPGDPEAFPETYFIDFETRDNDNVTNIKVVNGRLMVMLQTSVARVNYLPSERDSSFDRGKAFDWVSRSYGCVSPMCACVFSKDGGQETLAFVSDHGVHTTDGYNFDTVTDGLDWSQVISRTSTSNAIALIDDRDRQELLFYYRNDSNGNETYLCLHFSYSSEHMVNGRLKVSGPVHMRNFLSAGSLRASLESAWSARRTSGAQDIYLGFGGTATGAGAGQVYRETGTSLPAQDDTLKYATRRMYLADMSNEWRLNELYGHVGSYSGSPQITYTLNNAKTNASATGVGSKSVTLAGQMLHKVQFDQMAEGLIVTAQVTASAFAQEQLILDGDGWGVEDSGL